MRTRPTLSSGLALAAAAALGLASCDAGPPIPEADLLLRVTVGATDVELGAPFPITVVRVWSKELVPAAWDDRALAPLVLRLERTTRREDARRVEETRRYRGYAFARSDVLVPAAKLVARPHDGGADVTVRAEPLHLRVKPLLHAKAPGAPELATEALAEPRPRWPYAAGAAVLVVLLGFAVLRRRRPPAPPLAPPPPPPAPPVPADATALATLARIRARASAAPAELALDVADATGVLRGYLADRFGAPAAERTSEEILADASLADALAPARHAALRDVLGHSDRVKFAAHAPSRAERLTLLDATEAFVRGTAVPRAAASAAPTAPSTTGAP